MPWSRCQFRGSIAAVLLVVLVCRSAAAATGPAVEELAPFDRIIAELMAEWEIPGGAIAVAKDGRLVLARGYGLADVEKKELVKPDSLMRIASISKPITAAAILKLVEQRRLKLDDTAWKHLGTIEPPPGKAVNPRFREITIRQLLHHTAGFDRDKTPDPMFRSAEIAKALGVDAPAGSRSVIRFMVAEKLDFDPGKRHVYSNFGYCVLGRVIENVTGEDYEAAMRRLVLKPAGITRMRLGRTKLEDRADGEVRYYHPEKAEVKSVFPDVTESVSRPYGGFYLEALDAHGGWIASAVDLVRFATAADGSRKSSLFTPETRKLFESRPAVAKEKPAYYGLGWMIRPVKDSANWWHAGGLPGTSTLLVRTHHGMAWAVMFNRRPTRAGEFSGEVDRAMWKAVGEVQKWPKHDLFGQFE